VAAVVRAECRQDGLLGETVSVRNKLNGRLVVARVAGPGTVTIGR
jgi:flagella basal body P-ring formation protein FlgA